jgi:hypothetical protein
VVEVMSGEFAADDFEPTYQVKMIRAYPVISGMSGDVQMITASPEEWRAAFQRILDNRNLARTHQLYLEGKPRPIERLPAAELDVYPTCSGRDCGGYPHD